jgi:uncharacterized protein YndB with AHSA1/START domain
VRSQFGVTIPGRSPADVFPWLFDVDKVPRWTGSLERYERLDAGELRVGSRVRQLLRVADRDLTLDMEITRLDPPVAAESRFDAAGIRVVNAYTLAAADGGTRLTQAIDAEPSGFKARMLAPILQPRLQEKLEGDLARLREVLAAE